jgi:hypothetical protein
MTYGEDDATVGYKRPPRATRFRKGHSGNPRGRPRGHARDLPYESVLGRMVTVRDGDRERRMTAAEAYLIHLTGRGMEGDAAAARAALDIVEVARLRRDMQGNAATTIVRVCVAPGNPNTALFALGMARKLDRYRPTAYVMLEPWLVEAALQRLGSRRLTEQQQRAVLKVTRAPHKVHWPSWWSVNW